MDPFHYHSAATVSLSVSNSSSRVLVPGDSKHSGKMRISSVAGGADCFVEFGSSTITSTAGTGLHIMPGTVTEIEVPPNCTHMAGITSSSTATVYVLRSAGDPTIDSGSSHDPIPPVSTSFILLEDNSSYLLLEDGTSKFRLEA